MVDRNNYYKKYYEKNKEKILEKVRLYRIKRYNEDIDYRNKHLKKCKIRRLKKLDSMQSLNIIIKKIDDINLSNKIKFVLNNFIIKKLILNNVDHYLRNVNYYKGYYQKNKYKTQEKKINNRKQSLNYYYKNRENILMKLNKKRNNDYNYRLYINNYNREYAKIRKLKDFNYKFNKKQYYEYYFQKKNLDNIIDYKKFVLPYNIILNDTLTVEF